MSTALLGAAWSNGSNSREYRAYLHFTSCLWQPWPTARDRWTTSLTCGHNRSTHTVLAQGTEQAHGNCARQRTSSTCAPNGSDTHLHGVDGRDNIQVRPLSSPVDAVRTIAEELNCGSHAVGMLSQGPLAAEKILNLGAARAGEFDPE